MAAIAGQGFQDLLDAISNGNLSLVNSLLTDTALNVDERDEDGSTALHVASHEGHLEVVNALLQKQAISQEDDDGHQPIHLACAAAHEQIVKILLESGADVSVPCSNYGRTPLHVAAVRGVVGTLRLLVEYGADLDAVDASGHTPLDLAKRGEQTEAVEYLKGAGINAQDN